jgi:hypothetical protein
VVQAGRRKRPIAGARLQNHGAGDRKIAVSGLNSQQQRQAKVRTITLLHARACPRVNLPRRR